VLVATTAEGLETVATDRFRLAVARTGATVDGPPVRAVAPAAFVDEVRGLLDPSGGPVELTIAGADLVIDVAGHRVTGAALPGDFPDHQRLLASSTRAAGHRRITVDAAALRADLAPGVAPLVTQEHAGRTYPVAVLAVHPDGGLTAVDPSRWDADDPGTVAVNPEFLLQALDAGGDGQLVLDLDGPIQPLAIRPAGDPGRVSLLMPVRL
jgi:DNA polymerase III subunit beta